MIDSRRQDDGAQLIHKFPTDGTEALAWSITGGNWHQVYWFNYPEDSQAYKNTYAAPNGKRGCFKMRWTPEYTQGYGEFSHYAPLPAAPAQGGENGL